MSIVSSPPPPASGTVTGLLTHLAQVVGGVKTFVATIIASAGIQLSSLWNTNGTGASDVGVKVGVSTADASVNAAAKLLSVRTGLNGGTEVEYAALTKATLTLSGALVVNGYANSAISCSGSWLQLGTGAIPVRTGSYFQSTNADLSFYGPGRIAAGNTLRLASDSLGGTAGDSLVRIGAYLADGSVVGSAKLTSWVTGIGGTVVEKAIVTAAGEFESAVAGAGVVLKSPDGTRWRITVTNAGVLNVAAA